MQLCFALDLACALAEAAIVEHEQIKTGTPIEIRTGEPDIQIAGVAVQEEDQPFGIWLAKMQGRERGARHFDLAFHHVRFVEAEIRRQLDRVEQQRLLPQQHCADGGGVEQGQCQQRQQGIAQAHKAAGAGFWRRRDHGSQTWRKASWYGFGAKSA